MTKKKSDILITGSSGYLGAFLCPFLSSKHRVIGLDILATKETDIVSDIAELELDDKLGCDDGLIIVHCASARFDYGISVADYFKLNVEKTRLFLQRLERYNIKQFIHISSVAAIDGRILEYDERLGCDDAYRVTKYMQECLVVAWCKRNQIPCDVLLPSAIYDDAPRSDTNIGKLQSIVRWIPILPDIPVKKSLTYLPKFCAFIEQLVGRPTNASYLTIEKPVRTVTETMLVQSEREILTLRIPGLKTIFYVLAYILLGIGFFVKRDPILLPSRVTKLFSDTSYDGANESIDTEAYNRSIS